MLSVLINFNIISINIDEKQFNNIIMLIIGITGVYYSFYRLIPPCLQIDSLNNLLIYLSQKNPYPHWAYKATPLRCITLDGKFTFLE